MNVHLIDGTYELFRAHFALPPLQAPDGRHVGAVRGLMRTLLGLLHQEGVSHLACAVDRVVESFRNDLFVGYKTGAGVPTELMSQFELAEQAVSSLGIVTWSMVDFEADDAIATAAYRWRDDPRVERIIICSPDKDLMQMVQGQRVVCLDRRRNLTYDEDGVREKYGVLPESIPDYLGLVGDSADGIPGIPRWGAKTTATVLSRYRHIETIPSDPDRWDVGVRGAPAAASSLAENMEQALLYRRLATLRVDVGLEEELDQLEWRGIPREAFETLIAGLGFSENVRPEEWAAE